MPESLSLRSIVQGVLQPSPDRTAVVELVHRCHAMALAYLRLRRGPGTWLPSVSGMTREDTAFDCIAELFRRSPEGSFTCIASFFGGVDPDGTLGESDLQIQLRRLVFGAVNHHLFRMYREADPGLARIIRNVKLAVKRHPSLLLMEAWGLPVLGAAAASGGAHHLPLCEPEVSGPLFHCAVSPRSSLREMLDVLSGILSACEPGPCAIPLVEAALLIRAVHGRETPDPAGQGIPEALLRSDVERMIPEVLGLVRSKSGKGYHRSGKLTAQELEAHFRALRDILTEEYLGADGEAGTYFLTLGRHLPGLTEQAYRGRHREILEYLARTTKREARAWVAREWEFLQHPPDATKIQKQRAEDKPDD